MSGAGSAPVVFLRSHPLSRLICLSLLLFLLTACAKQTALTSNGSEREGVLLVAFGTSVPEAEVAIRAVEADFKKAFPDSPVVLAYTSQIIRKKLAREGRRVGGIGEGLTQLACAGVRRIRVQSLHIMAGEEFSALERAVLLEVKAHPGRFDQVLLGRPMLESRKDAQKLARAVLSAHIHNRSTALVLMGHGQEHGRAGLCFEGVRSVFRETSPSIFMASVEGERGFDELLRDLKKSRVKKVVLAPLMLVAGDHARNDLCGDEDDSWAMRLKKAGLACEPSLMGLGEIQAARDILIAHARESQDDLTKEPRKR